MSQISNIRNENVCTFSKFGYCKFGKKCRNDICAFNYCDKVKFCKKRHPRKCYYFCAYGYCKFGCDCQFKHENEAVKDTRRLVDDNEKCREENKNLKIELSEISEKCEKVKVELDKVMEQQSKQDIRDNEYIKKETDLVQRRFIQQFETPKELIAIQNKKIFDLSTQIEVLMIENVELKRKKLFECDECNYETKSIDKLQEHRQEYHSADCDTESESESEERIVY